VVGLEPAFEAAAGAAGVGLADGDAEGSGVGPSVGLDGVGVDGAGGDRLDGGGREGVEEPGSGDRSGAGEVELVAGSSDRVGVEEQDDPGPVSGWRRSWLGVEVAGEASADAGHGGDAAVVADHDVDAGMGREPRRPR
jgi:hypothetical protein